MTTITARARRIAFRTAATLLVGGIAFAGAWMPDQTPHVPRAVMAGDAAYIIGEPTYLAGPRVTSVLPAPDGPYVLIVREKPKNAVAALTPTPAGAPLREAQMEILLWNRQTRRVSAVWEQPADSRVMATLSGGISWVPKSSVAVAAITRYTENGGDSPQEHLLLLIDTRSAHARVLPADIDGVLIASGDSPVAALVHMPGPAERSQGAGQTIRAIGADGRIGPVIAVPPDISSVSGEILPGGKAIYAYRRTGIDPTTKRRKIEHFAISLTDGTVTPLETRPEPAPDLEETVSAAIKALPIRLATRRAHLRSDTGEEDIPAVYLDRVESSDSNTPPVPTAATAPTAAQKAAPAVTPGKDRDMHALVALDADAVTLTPDGGGALYRSRSGGLYGLPIARMDKEAFLDGRRKVYREMTMNNAKQIGLAILMYSQDFDERFPTAGGNVPDMIDPYIKDQSLFQNPETGAFGFTFVSPGVPDLASVKEPATTVIGYVSGPGGRAAIYVDGHVRWEDH